MSFQLGMLFHWKCQDLADRPLGEAWTNARVGPMEGPPGGSRPGGDEDHCDHRKLAEDVDGLWPEAAPNANCNCISPLAYPTLYVVLGSMKHFTWAVHYATYISPVIVGL